MRGDVSTYVANCFECQCTKYETKKKPGLLCPLPVPHQPWEDLSLDFIMGLPPYQGNTVILVVLDQFSKGVHLGMLPAAHTAHAVASLFLTIVVKIHGQPRSLVSDRDPLFLSKFWQELFRMSGTQLRMSSAYHPQSDGQTEVINRVIEQYLRAFVHRKPSTWGKLLPWAEYSHNTSWSSSTGSTPYEITFGKKPFNFLAYVTGQSSIDAVDTMLTDRNELFEMIRKKLLKAQDSMKNKVDIKRREVSYQEGDWVLLKLRPHRQSSAKGPEPITGNLSKRFFGPFQVVERVGKVAYRLQLPVDAKLHPVFHCSLLKPFQGNPPDTAAPLPPTLFDHQSVIAPLVILATRTVNDDDIEVLVQWQGLSPDDATWEKWTELCKEFHLEDKVLPHGPWNDTGETNTSTKTAIQNQEFSSREVQLEVRPKRAVNRPSYLKDYI